MSETSVWRVMLCQYIVNAWQGLVALMSELLPADFLLHAVNCFLSFNSVYVKMPTQHNRIHFNLEPSINILKPPLHYIFYDALNQKCSCFYTSCSVLCIIVGQFKFRWKILFNPSVLWRCCLGERSSIAPIKTRIITPYYQGGNQLTQIHLENVR